MVRKGREIDIQTAKILGKPVDYPEIPDKRHRYVAKRNLSKFLGLGWRVSKFNKKDVEFSDLILVERDK